KENWAAQGPNHPMRGGISKMSVAPWPTVGVGTTSRAVTAHGGATLLRDVMSAVGLVEEVDANVGLKQRGRGLTEGEFMAAMAESIALGASCLDDLAVARSDAAQEGAARLRRAGAADRWHVAAAVLPRPHPAAGQGHGRHAAPRLHPGWGV